MPKRDRSSQQPGTSKTLDPAEFWPDGVLEIDDVQIIITPEDQTICTLFKPLGRAKEIASDTPKPQLPAAKKESKKSESKKNKQRATNGQDDEEDDDDFRSNYDENKAKKTELTPGVYFMWIDDMNINNNNNDNDMLDQDAVKPVVWKVLNESVAQRYNFAENIGKSRALYKPGTKRGVVPIFEPFNVLILTGDDNEEDRSTQITLPTPQILDAAVKKREIAMAEKNMGSDDEDKLKSSLFGNLNLKPNGVGGNQNSSSNSSSNSGNNNNSNSTSAPLKKRYIDEKRHSTTGNNNNNNNNQKNGENEPEVSSPSKKNKKGKESIVDVLTNGGTPKKMDPKEVAKENEEQLKLPKFSDKSPDEQDADAFVNALINKAIKNMDTTEGIMSKVDRLIGDKITDLEENIEGTSLRSCRISTKNLNSICFSDPMIITEGVHQTKLPEFKVFFVCTDKCETVVENLLDLLQFRMNCLNRIKRKWAFMIAEEEDESEEDLFNQIKHDVKMKNGLRKSYFDLLKRTKS